MQLVVRLLLSLLGLGVAVGIAAAVALGVYAVKLLPELPATESIQEIRLSEPLRIYTADEKLIGVYGSERRVPVDISEVPETLVQAILAAEDDSFYAHPGVDIVGIGRALLANLRSGEHDQGASTITMQVARNFFLTREKTYTRKLKEILLALRLEKDLSKDEILELYVNKIFLGQRAYGFAAAAQVYYGKTPGELTIAESAMLAGLPKAPSRNNPISNPDNAKDRRNYILRRMNDLDYIDDETFAAERDSELTAELHIAAVDADAPYAAEMARQHMVEQFGEDAYEAGYDVYVTIDSSYQQAADKALRHGLIAYDERHGYRGAVNTAELENTDETDWDILLKEFQPSQNVLPAIVTEVEDKQFQVYLGEEQYTEVEWAGIRWAGKFVNTQTIGGKPKRASDVVSRGDIVYVQQFETDIEGEKKQIWRLTQIPEIAGALVSLDPNTGAILALSGGFDYYLSKYNRAVQAERQPGSNLKPFIYSAALEAGFTPATLVSGAPIVVEDSIQGVWRPENYSGRFYGPTRLRKALSLSLNLVSVRLLRAMGTDFALTHMENFGFDSERLPNGLSLALGSASVTPVQVAKAFAVFANGGYQVQPYFVDRIVDRDGVSVAQSDPTTLCENCKSEEGYAPLSATSARYAPRVISAQNAFLTASLMQQVIRSGTGQKALALGRNDLSGKTGTTNSFRDAWFSGFNGDVITSVWVGFDDSSELGRAESGARAALPIWVDYMEAALEGKPEKPPVPPAGIVRMRVNKESGAATSKDDPNSFVEYFAAGTQPTTQHVSNIVDTTSSGGETSGVNTQTSEQNLF